MDFNSELEKLWPELLVISAKVCHGSSIEPSDLAADTAVAALINMRQYRPGSNMMAWLCTIMKHRLIDLCRRRKAQLTAMAGLVDRAYGEIAASEGRYTEGEVLIIAKIDELPPKQQDAVRRHLLSGSSSYDIAEELGITRAAALSRLKIGLLALRMKLKKEAVRWNPKD